MLLHPPVTSHRTRVHHMVLYGLQFGVAYLCRFFLCAGLLLQSVLLPLLLYLPHLNRCALVACHGYGTFGTSLLACSSASQLQVCRFCSGVGYRCQCNTTVVQ